MSLLNYVLFTLINLFILTTAQFDTDDAYNALEGAINGFISDDDIYISNNKNENHEDTNVDVKLYYESLCPYSIRFYKNKFNPVVEKLHQYLDIHTYPYGNAKTIEINGSYTFKCQHGPAECYGNKLHACAIDYLQNITEAVMFTACMMSYNGGSDDQAADRCGSSMSVDSGPIKACAKQERGTQLLKYYGDETKKANLSYVPYILINGKISNGKKFMEEICAEFAVPPPPCVDL